MSNVDETERIKYKEKVKKQEIAINNLLDIASQHTRLFSNTMLKALNERKQECGRLYRKLDKNEFEIAIVGLEKAGKSTFANALMGNKILPDADARCTYTSTCIRYGNDRAVVKFFTESEFDQKLRDNLAAMGFGDVEQYSLSTLNKYEYEKMFGSLKQGEQMAFGNNIHKDILNIFNNKEALLNIYLGKEDIHFEGDDLKGEELKKYIVSKDVAIAVKEVSIESSKLKNMKNAIIYDVPGFDSPTKIHAEQTEDRMRKADVIILIASAEKPSFTAPSLDMFNKVVDEDNVELSDKLFVFGNRADAANTLEKNIQTLKNEVLGCNLLNSRYLDSRLFVGSAKAYLQKIRQEKGDFCVKKLETEEFQQILKHGDGIEYTYNQLLEYNKTDRFRVLKRKVNENDQNIQKIFKELRDEYKDIENSFGDMKVLFQEGNKLCNESRRVLKRGLEVLREEVREKYNNEQLLSNKMKDEINQLFESGKYLITEDELTDAKLKIGGTKTIVDVVKVEEIIREKKFKDIYNEFSQTVLKIATADHKEYYNKIAELFCEALQTSKNSAHYDEINQKINGLIEKHKKSVEEEDNYQALIERFVRDLVEVLVLNLYGQEARLNRFMADKNIFSGLIMFYDPGNNEKYKKTFMATAPKDQPLLYSLLFHEYKDSIDACQSIFGYLSSITEGIYDSTIIMQLICSIVKKNPVMAFETIKNAIQKQEFSKYKEDDIIQSIAGKIKNAQRNIPFAKIPFAKEDGINSEMKDYDFTDSEKFAEQYKRHFGNQKTKTYDDITQEYEIDLKILQDFLVSASIPAISIEKPFIAKEVKSIEELLDYADSSDFSDFVTNNFDLLCKDTYDEFNRKQKERVVNQAVIREIESVLREMNEM